MSEEARSARGHRNGCQGCAHAPGCFPPCWTQEQVDAHQEQVQAFVTGMQGHETPDVTIAVDFTAAELAKVTQAAEASGMTPAAFALWAAVSRAEAVIDPLRAGAA